MCARIASLGIGDASIQEFGDHRTLQIRMGLPKGGEDAANAVGSQVRARSTQRYPGTKFARANWCRAKSRTSSPVGAMAIALAMLGIAIFIWFRFEWQLAIRRRPGDKAARSP